jgi:predicted HTH transcriptional regulator
VREASAVSVPPEKNACKARQSVSISNRAVRRTKEAFQMPFQDLISGESKTVEFKESLPEKSIKYMKTVIAYANGKGGKIIFGVQDGTCKVVGIDKDEVFKTMDAITNAILDSCEPAIIPDVTLQTVEDKTLIVVEINEGRQRPYYIKSLGLRNGTYIKVSGTTRVADDYMLKELILEGQNKYYDQELCADLAVTKDDIKMLCDELKSIAMKNSISEADKAQVRDVTENILLTWGVLAEKEKDLVPTNAFALLTGNDLLPTQIQCGIFKDNTRTIFLDKQEFSGAIQEQLEAAYQYVLAKINLGAKIDGLYRQDVYEFPIGTIRELIANAVAHRSYLEPNNIQIALYDDRLEITSPGMLLNGVSIEKIKAGYSKIRNRAIANAFSYMKIIEKWGSGIPRILRECEEYGLREPELIDFDGDFRVNLYRNKNGTIGTIPGTIGTIPGTIGTIPGTIHTGVNGVTDAERILSFIKANPKSTQNEVHSQMGIAIRSVKRIMAELQEKGAIMRKGNNRTGEWIVK